jgi:tetratricopeptide (TPR) repeat protein
MFMGRARCRTLNARRLDIAAFFAAILAVCALPCFGQQNSSRQSTPSKPANATPRLKSHDSITVTATYTPEEK